MASANFSGAINGLSPGFGFLWDLVLHLDGNIKYSTSTETTSTCKKFIKPRSEGRLVKANACPNPILDTVSLVTC